MILSNLSDSRPESDWLRYCVDRHVGGTQAFLKNVRVGLHVSPIGYNVDRNINGRCIRYSEVILEGEGSFLVPSSILGRAILEECVIAYVDIKQTVFVRKDGYEMPILSGTILYEE